MLSSFKSLSLARHQSNYSRSPIPNDALALASLSPQAWKLHYLPSHSSFRFVCVALHVSCSPRSFGVVRATEGSQRVTRC
eukprot:m.598886 g.598886  ORF g.598886 m.598886 type:complete len:80 (-) comp58076_c0_seq43:2399-2638(-)